VGKRRTAREMALRMLYQSDLGGASAAEVLASFDLGEFLAGAEEAPDAEAGGGRRRLAPAALDVARQAFEHARDLVIGAIEHREELDRLIRTQAENWRLERMPPVDRNILRLAVYELLHQSDVPRLVVVDEAVDLAKAYGSENSSRFVNGLLDGLLHSGVLPKVSE
jgi:N utilization substance protein B